MQVHRLAPAVRHAFGPSAGLGWAVGLLCAAGLLCSASWLVLSGPRSVAATIAVPCLWLVCAALAWRWWRALPCGQLVWDGQGWSLERSGWEQPQALTGPPEVCLDLQSTLLLRGQLQHQPALWLWLSRCAAAPTCGAWLPLRRALYSRAPEAPAPDSNAVSPSDSMPG